MHRKVASSCDMGDLSSPVLCMLSGTAGIQYNSISLISELALLNQVNSTYLLNLNSPNRDSKLTGDESRGIGEIDKPSKDGRATTGAV